MGEIGDELRRTGAAEVRIPAKLIEELVALRPDHVSAIRLGAGTIHVETAVGDVLVTPDVGFDTGLIEMRLNRLHFLENHEIVRRLVRALNAPIVEHRGRVRAIQVTPEAIIVTVARDQGS
jgi:hypothetical protein